MLVTVATSGEVLLFHGACMLSVLVQTTLLVP